MDLSFLCTQNKSAIIHRVIADIYTQGITPNAEKADVYYRLSADNGDPKAQYIYAMKIFEHAYDFDSIDYSHREDIKLAIEMLLSSAKSGYAEAQFEVAMHEKPVITYEKIKWLTLASEQSHTRALYHLAWHYQGLKEYEKACQNYKLYLNTLDTYLEKGDEESKKNVFAKPLYDLANFYYRGQGTKQDYKSALYHYIRFLELIGDGYSLYSNYYYIPEGLLKQCQAYAHSQIADMHYQGLGTQVDYFEAMYHYKQSVAFQDDGRVYFKLHQMYKFGQGSEIDQIESNKYLRLSADEGHAEALYQLGVKIYHANLAMDKDEYTRERYERVIECLTQACDKNHVEACVLLGIIYWHLDSDICEGGDCQECANSAKYWLKAKELTKVDERTDVNFYLATMYDFGYYFKRDWEEAINLYEIFLQKYRENDESKIAIRTHINYSDVLRLYRFDLEEIKKDYEKGRRCCEILAKHGNVTAQYIIGWLIWTTGNGRDVDKEESFKWYSKATLNDKGELKEIKETLKTYENEMIIYKLGQINSEKEQISKLKIELSEATKTIADMKCEITKLKNDIQMIQLAGGVMVKF